jgi:polygalacturonase
MTYTSYDITSFGAIAGPNADPILNASAIQQTIDKCSQAGGGRVIVPANLHFITSPFDFKSGIELHLEPNSSLIADPDESHYKKSAFKENFGEGSIWIGGEHADVISITGMGTLDGNGIAFMGPEEKPAYVLKPITNFDPRPHLLTLVGCKKITIRDVTFKNSAYWCVHLAGCEDVVISGVRIENSLKIRNCDGIDLDHSKNVRISDCYIQSGDDCICLKNRREYEEYGPCENITVSGCIMTSTSCSFKIGSENMDAIRNVVVTNCIITKSNRGIGIQNRDEGIVEKVLFSNIVLDGRLFDNVWWGKAEPIYITAFRRAPSATRDANWRFAKGQTEGKVGPVRNIRFVNCSAISENGVFISGEPGMISDILLDQITLQIHRTTAYPHGCYDRRPCVGEGIIMDKIGGFYIDTAENITIRNSRVIWQISRNENRGELISQKNIQKIHIENVSEE